ncbi:MAG: tripartite tricarboxylate transporter substrate binding protein [Rhodospirillales bacterium]|nr:tripartite tricarboxylate transporter substrate binding protein [Rhodospirillales bacterium]
MKKTLFACLFTGVAAVGLSTAPTPAQAVDLPCDTAKLIVPWAAGGGTHILFTLFEKTIQELDVKTKLKVVTISGQGGNKGAKEAHDSKPDGCTLFAIHQSAFTSYLNGRMDYHYNGFTPIAMVTSTPDIVGASTQMPWNNFEEMKKAVLAEPETYTVGATFGSTSQFYWQVLEARTGMKFKYVPYDGTAQRTKALLSGAINLGGINVAANRKLIEGGSVKAFAIAADKRSSFFPEIPTLKELGVDMVYALDRGIVGPLGMSQEVIDYWADVLEKATQNPELQKVIAAKGTDLVFVGPKPYAAWAEKVYAEHEEIAIATGAWTKK